MSDRDSWAALQEEAPRVAAELEEVRTCHLLRTLPRAGGLRDQSARFSGALEYLVNTGLMVERTL